MLYMTKTTAGTISCNRYEQNNVKGISIGVYNKESYACLECQNNQLVLLVNDDTCKDGNIHIVHTKRNWKPTETERERK